MITALTTQDCSTPRGKSGYRTRVLELLEEIGAKCPVYVDHVNLVHNEAARMVIRLSPRRKSLGGNLFRPQPIGRCRGLTPIIVVSPEAES